MCVGSAYAVLHYEGATDPYDLEFTDADFLGVYTTHETEVGSEREKVERKEGQGEGKGDSQC